MSITQQEINTFINAEYNLYHFLKNEHLKTTLTDQEFATSDPIKKKVFEFVKNCKNVGIKTSFNNLTNRNSHFLVHILVINNFFKTLDKESKKWFLKKPLNKNYN